MRYAFLVGYFGDRFHGLVRQPGLRTVEGDLLDALKSLGYLEEPPRSVFSSRTDKGVSALQNIWAVNLAREPVLGEINASLEGIWLYGYTRVDERFDPRRYVLKKWYRYVFPERFSYDALRRMRAASRLFLGKHNFVSFCIPESKNTVRDVQRIEIFNVDLTVMDIFAKGFLRQMVRRIATAIYMVGKGVWTFEDVRERFLQRIPVAPMPAEGLILVKTYPSIHFVLDDEQLERMMAAWKERMQHLRVKSSVMRSYMWFELPR